MLGIAGKKCALQMHEVEQDEQKGFGEGFSLLLQAAALFWAVVVSVLLVFIG